MEPDWKPLESSPDTFTPFARTLGMAPALAFHDLCALEPWALDMLPAPPLAVVLLFPYTQAHLQFVEEQAVTLPPAPPGLFYMRQNVKNACGTIAILHALFNLASSGAEVFEPGSVLATRFEKWKGLTPEEIGSQFRADEELEKLHREAVCGGKTDAEAPVDSHFIALVEAGGQLVELDGRKQQAVAHGPTSTANFGVDCLRVIQEFMDREKGSVLFAVQALVRTG
ncbi:ubiquitin carboxyl-terminal hydrolase-like [Hippocampus zosterae]|uniref:ubiquitin carboxyl-terminal hydrolase-like n=1 Tax=Hippocampus zosterae TaxID=109293 RepID=UPI00223D64DC|nr:ubiquitin carboxyl-terminal hydrolase-like [Hippocampus zosterae]